MFDFLISENFKLRRRYGKILNIESLTSEQKKLLLDQRVKDNVDGLGNRTVGLLENKIEGVSLSLVDEYCYNNYVDKKNKGDYVLERSKIYRKILDKFPEYSGSWENRYRLSDGSLISVSFEVKGNVKKR